LSLSPPPLGNTRSVIPSPPSLRAATKVAALFLGPASDACIGKQGPKKRERGARPLSLSPPPLGNTRSAIPSPPSLRAATNVAVLFFWMGEWVESALNSSWYFTCVGLRQGLTRLARKT
jgi:hypothetical protein